MKTSQPYSSQSYSTNPSNDADVLPVIGDSELKLLKVLSLLIDYPSNELFEGDAFAQCKQIVAKSTLISPQVRSQIIRLIDDLIEMGSLEAQSRYDGLFERGRSLSLWLFEHVHGESRDRGQAMVDLMGQYEEAGFEIGVKELPDFLPLYLEFLAYQATVIEDDIQIRMDIADVSHIIALLAARLGDRQSLYQGCFNALLQIAGKPLEMVDDFQEKISKETRDDTFEALDKEWEEEVVDFLGAQQEERCPSETSTHNLAAKAGVRPAKAKNAVDAPVHWVDFKQNPSVKQ
ncbi:respiratory nitrate reductase chaperone NarJ [Psychrobacter arcticus 273-4]|uniref:Respiratory nitrate reductase chaperone NarJ n=1 Tax=Psychrobacter arcticus (strain DSM 17307 / VKM B-2377 / 273-4) TaxID=259536 RepID=Q4FU41_PSYA2|nr:nitrate reductase molybdenum cofactor assembly chaperone [Psychrobacter arcticus]AAZ18467.1 respiratory nitrate reductase chaperone NarJ [Psychrobacter arcticus 273-4]